MGLNTTHGAWDGPYSTFGEWRQYIAKQAGFPPLHDMQGFGGDIAWDGERASHGDQRLIPLLTHSDCDGYLRPYECLEIACGLGDLISKADERWSDPWRFETRKFIKGCMRAYIENEPMEFC